MNKKTNKILSFVTSLAVVGTLYIPCITASASEINTNSKLQAQAAVLSKSLDNNYKVKINSENLVEVSTNKVVKMNTSAKAASGMVYGKWFGGVDSTYRATMSEAVVFSVGLFAVINPFLKSTSMALTVARSIAAYLGMTKITVKKGQYIKANRTKRYRQVTYSDGTFAYWQTKVGATVWINSTAHGYGETILSGGMY